MQTDRFIGRCLGGLAMLAGLALAAAAPAQVPYPGPPAPTAEAPPPQRGPVRARSFVRPYLEVDQVVSAQLDGDGDVLTYTALAAGVDGRIETRRITAQASYRYERRIAWNGDLPDRDVHSGVAMVHAEVVPGLLAFDAGALAARTGGEGRAIGVTDREAAVNVYSVYAGPTLTARAGPVAVSAAYRLGYAAIDDDTPAGVPGAEIDDTIVHSASASASMGPGRLPFGWTVSAGYGHEEAGDLDHEFEGMYVRGDVVVPVTPTFALTAGVGYEKIEASQLAVLVDEDGVPVIGPDGRPVPDPSRPRQLALDIDGLIYDGGFIWRPSARTELQARAGHRYGGTSVVASLRHDIGRNWGVRAAVYDGIETFGRLLISDLQGLPDDFQNLNDPLADDLGFGGCVFGVDAGSGVCLDRSLQAITGATFRHRGANLLLSGGHGPWRFGAGAGYSRRRYFEPVGSSSLLIEPRVDESLTLFGSAGRRLSRTSSVGFNAYATWFDSDRAAFDEQFSTGFAANYSRRFLLDRLQLIAALGLNHSDGGVFDSTVASALLGLRYNF